MKQYFITTISAVLLILMAYFAGCKTSAATVEKPNANIDRAILLAMDYLSKNTLSTGRFVYNASIDSNASFNTKSYNALRHAGTLYSMYLCERVLDNAMLKEKRYLASEYFVKNYVREVKPNLYAVISKMEEEKLDTEQAKLGGTGLALIGLSNLYPEGKIDLKILRGLGDFAIYMQKEDGSFYSKYDVTKAQIDTKFTSLYYPGEVAYGLLFLNEVDPQKKWVDCAKKALLYLAYSRKDKGLDVPFDHWAMLATRKLFETPDNGLSAIEKKWLQVHAEQMAYSKINEQIVDAGHTYQGGLLENLRLCSLGTIMEGFVAIYYITDDENLKHRVYKFLDLGTSFLADYQVKDGNKKGGIPTTAYWKLSNAPKNSLVIRIDNVQHVISAWITFKELKKLEHK